MATITKSDHSGRLIPDPTGNAGRHRVLVTAGDVTLRIEAVHPCDLHLEDIRAIVREGTVRIEPSNADVLPLRAARRGT